MRFCKIFKEDHRILSLIHTMVVQGHVPDPQDPEPDELPVCLRRYILKGRTIVFVFFTIFQHTEWFPVNAQGVSSITL